MECYKGALKSSLVGELAFQAIPIPSDEITGTEDFLGLDGVEDFSNIDCFFDFGEFSEGCVEKTLKELNHDDQDGTNVEDDSSSNFSSSSNSFLDTELCASVGHVEVIEWLSEFVGDFSSEHHPVLYNFEPEPRPVSVQPSCVLPSHVPTKRRTKRSRQIGRSWFGSNSTDYSSSSSSSSFSSSSPCLIYANIQTMDILHGWSEPATKKPKNRSQTSTGSTQLQRRCSHCQVNKTPQWRTGPLGAKTLCNACGVRYKSGRLFPEYRPACSPTFSSDVHSNSHRKVLEIRRTKESCTVEPNFEPNGLGFVKV